MNAAIQENVDVIGLSFLSGEHMIYAQKVMDGIKEKNLQDVLFIIGGVIPKEDITMLKEMGEREIPPRFKDGGYCQGYT